jgi:glycosyltransferase involved in cell wall biosynthesis
MTSPAPSAAPRISVVIPCHRCAHELHRCLDALRQQTLAAPYEIIVVNSGADTAVRAVAAGSRAVRVISSEERLMPGAARNLGARHARADYLAFIDADCIAEPDWLAHAFQALKAGAPIVGGAVLDALPLHPIAVADNLLQFIEFSPYRPERMLPYVPSCNFAIRREAFAALGGFPDGLPTAEDGLFNRAAAAHWPDGLAFLPAMRVRHMGRRTLRTFWRHQAMLGFYRGRLGLGLRRRWYQRLGRRTIAAVPIAAKRLSMLVARTVRWNPRGLVRVVLVSPFLLVGLIAWTTAFRDGCRLALREAR